MGILDSLGRKRSDNRVRRRSLLIDQRQRQTDPDEALEATLTNYQNQAYRFGKRMYDTTQARKTEGKQLFKSTLWSGVGIVTRTILGPRKTSTTTQRSTRSKPTSKPITISKPTLNINKKQRRK